MGRKSAIERILDRAVPDGDCLIYPCDNPATRYPQLYVDGKRRSAHQLMWEYHYGSRNGAHVLHSCDRTRCVQIKHLHLGTHADNMREMAERGRSKKGRLLVTHCRNGHEYTPENTGSNGEGKRACLKCHADRQLARNIARREGPTDAV